MQLKLGVSTTFLTHEEIVEMAQGALLTIGVPPERRAGVIIALIDAIISLGWFQRNVAVLLKAEQVLEAEMSDLSLSVFCVNLICHNLCSCDTQTTYWWSRS
jgi:hypothetical protein